VVDYAALKWDKFEQDGVKSYLNWKQLEEKKHTQTIDSVLQRFVCSLYCPCQTITVGQVSCNDRTKMKTVQGDIWPVRIWTVKFPGDIWTVRISIVITGLGLGLGLVLGFKDCI